MKFEDLPTLWKGRELAGENVRLAERIVSRSKELEKVVRRRDRLETAVALLLAPFFGAVVVMGSSTIGRIGGAILFLSCLFIPLRLARARRLFKPSPADRPVREFLGLERDRLLAQKHLLRTVLWWYLLPLGIGVVLLFGSKSPAIATGIYVAVVIAFFSWLYVLNQQAVGAELDPRLQEIDDMLRAVDMA